MYRQEELAELESKLSDLDDEDASSCPKALKSREMDESRTNLPYSRKLVMQEIDMKSKEYRESRFATNVKEMWLTA